MRRKSPHASINALEIFEIPASGSGDPGAPDTPHPRRPRRLGPRLRHRPEVRGTSRKDGWQSQDPSAPSHPGKTPNGPQAQAHQPRAQPRWPENAQQLTGPTPTEPPSHRAILPFHHPIMAGNAGGRCRRLATINGARVAHPQPATRRIMRRRCQCRASAPGSKCHHASETSRLSRCRWPASRRVSCSIALDVVVDAALAQALHDARWVDDGLCAVPLYSGMGRGHH